VEIDVLIAKMRIPASPNAENIVPAMDGLSRKWGPKIEMIPTGE
jgi:hypothetical protein